MKILEINSFMTWAENYGSGHELVYWMSKREPGGERGKPKGGFRRVLEGVRWSGRLRREGFDLIVCGAFGRSYQKKRLARYLKYFYERVMVWLIASMAKRSGTPLAVVDIADDTTIHPVNRRLLEVAKVYFKRELPIDPFLALDSFRSNPARGAMIGYRKEAWWQRLVAKLEPVSLGCREREPERRFIPMRERKWDVFYVGSDNLKPCREGIREALNALEQEGKDIYCPEEALELDEYFEAMAHSRLTVSPPGLGWDCHRHYESSMVGGVVVTPFPTIQRMFPLKNGEEGYFYDVEKGLASELRGLLERDESELERVARAGQEKAWRHHTHAAHFEAVVERTMARVSN